MVTELFKSKEINETCSSIAKEFAHRNLFAFRDFPLFVSDSPKSPLGKMCSDLVLMVKDILSQDNNLLKFTQIVPRPRAVGHALFMAETEGEYDLDKVSVHYSVSLVQEEAVRLDEHIENLLNQSLCDELGIKINEDFLTDLSDRKLELKKHGIIFDNKVLIYPHQFLRRHFSSNFVELPVLLSNALKAGLSVHIRIDPLRRSIPEYYQDVMEFDYWHGQPFSEALLKNEHTVARTIHGNAEANILNYHIKRTVFRTDMMDKHIRQFKIEEYADIQSESGSPTSGAGDNFFIQRFAHMCYDQKIDKFIHLDGAVRVFPKEEYKNYLNEIESGKDVDEKVGVRHKMFLIEGEFDQSLASDVLAEWFRYNNHIQEYFSSDQSEDITYREGTIV